MVVVPDNHCFDIDQEFDSPQNLYMKPNSMFRGMCDRSAITLDDIKLARKAMHDVRD